MEQQSGDFGRIWRRTIGIAALALFVTGLLVAMDLEELVLIAGLLIGMCTAVGVLTLALVRYRRGLLRLVTAAARVTRRQVVRAARRTGTGGRRASLASLLGGRRAALAVAAGAGEVARGSRSEVRRALPVLRRADDELGVRVRTIAAAGRRRAVRTFELILADIHAHQDAIRAADRRRPPNTRAGAVGSSAARRARATRSAAERRRE